jgi:hypothetical protein
MIRTHPWVPATHECVKNPNYPLPMILTHPWVAATHECVKNRNYPLPMILTHAWVAATHGWVSHDFYPLPITHTHDMGRIYSFMGWCNSLPMKWVTSTHEWVRSTHPGFSVWLSFFIEFALKNTPPIL